MLFYLKKIIAPFLLPPGIFILLLTVSGVWLLRQKRCGKAGVISLCFALGLWIFSCGPLSYGLMKGLEHTYRLHAHPQGDVIVLLGGGSNQGVPDISGKGFPNGEMLSRVVTAARLQKRLQIPLIISSGQVFPDTPSEAPIVRRILTDLGVPEDKIIMEVRSRDTHENALYSKEICEKNRYTRPILVTSAAHMRRSVLTFHQAGMTVLPFPASFHTSAEKKAFGWENYLPNAGALLEACNIAYEYLGILFYLMAY
ncbi:MAG: YdcF family protein [Nitrospirales bacterium]|nr:YdcF family protein [Nitrospirales bacterium]